MDHELWLCLVCNSLNEKKYKTCMQCYSKNIYEHATYDISEKLLTSYLQLNDMIDQLSVDNDGCIVIDNNFMNYIINKLGYFTNVDAIYNHILLRVKYRKLLIWRHWREKVCYRQNHTKYIQTISNKLISLQYPKRSVELIKKYL